MSAADTGISSRTLDRGGGLQGLLSANDQKVNQNKNRHFQKKKKTISREAAQNFLCVEKKIQPTALWPTAHFWWTAPPPSGAWRAPRDGSTPVPFTQIDCNRHRLINSAWKERKKKRSNRTKQKKSQKHSRKISRGLRNVSLEMVGQRDQFISSPSRDRLHGAQNVPVPPSLLVIIIWPVAHSLWNYTSPTLESTCSTFFFSLSKVSKNRPFFFSQRGVWQMLMTHQRVPLRPCLFPQHLCLFRSGLQCQSSFWHN